MDNETLLSESKYLSEFFMEEFEIENEPKYKQIEKIKNEHKLNLEHSYLIVTQNLGVHLIQIVIQMKIMMMNLLYILNFKSNF